MGIIGKPLFDNLDQGCSVSSVVYLPPHELDRERIRRHLLSYSSKYRVHNACVRPVLPPPLEKWAVELGECADSSCGCCRLGEPRVRSRFRNVVVARTAHQLVRTSNEAARYASVACGRFLTDFEILCGLVEKGLSIERICVVDTLYQHTQPHELCRSLVAFFAPVRVIAFGSLNELEKAAAAEPCPVSQCVCQSYSCLELRLTCYCLLQGPGEVPLLLEHTQE